MTEQAAAKRAKGYNLVGLVTAIVVLKDRKGAEYARFKFATEMNGKPMTRTTMAFGATYQEIAPTLQEGTMRLFVIFDGGTLKVLALGKEPKQTTAANDDAPAPEAQAEEPMAEQAAAEPEAPAKPKRARRSRAKAQEAEQVAA